MKSTPILFGREMVIAHREGRKTQTRRLQGLDVLNERPYDFAYANVHPHEHDKHVFYDNGKFLSRCIKSPYGGAGDELWIRETWGGVFYSPSKGYILQYRDVLKSERTQENCQGLFYLADGHDSDREGCYVPSIHMFDWACRFKPPIISVRPERLQSINEDDAIAEGIMTNDEYSDRVGGYDVWICPRCRGFRTYQAGSLAGAYEVDCTDCDTPVKRYAQLWDSLSPSHPWSGNPWVWRIEYERSEAKL